MGLGTVGLDRTPVMKVRSRFRGPKLRTKLLLFGLILLVVPWLSYLQLLNMEQLLVQSKKNSQLLVASSVATLFNNREDLLGELPAEIDESNFILAHPIEGTILLDGEISDWGTPSKISPRTFGEADGGINLTLGERIEFLYCYLEINDAELIYRNPSLVEFDTSDHVRIHFRNVDNVIEQLALTFTMPGVITSYRLGIEETGQSTPDTEIGGFMRETDSGFVLEVVIPLKIIGKPYSLGVVFHDVDTNGTEQVVTRTYVTPNSEQELFELFMLRSAETIRLIEGLGYANTRIIIADRLGRIRGEFSSQSQSSNSFANNQNRGTWINRIFKNFSIGQAFRDLQPEDNAAVQREAIESALRGEPRALESMSLMGEPLIVAAHPIRHQEVVGAAVVEENVDSILQFQQNAFQQILFVSLLTLGIIIAVLLGYAVRLAFRIQRLRRSTVQAIDEYGRLRTSSINTEINAGDEIGDLARSIDGMLTRLSQHQTFLQRMPRTLRHEINNPLNTVSTSLENLQQTTDTADWNKYLESARRGITRIGIIVQNLSDAASLEDSLRNEQRTRVDLQALVKSYVTHLNSSRKDTKFLFKSDEQPLFINASDVHIEQMLDKIVDNAIDFYRKDSAISVFLERGRSQVRLIFANRGPTFPDDTRMVFDSLTSMRSTPSKMHFGLGLYVVRVIAESHNGTVEAINLEDSSGVAIIVTLPLAEQLATGTSYEKRA